MPCRRFFLFVILLFPGLQVFAQKEVNNWYFGNNAGVDFSSGSPVATSDGALVSMEGVSSISDASGNLLFYTNGMIIYDKTHNAMPNGSGLLGGGSSSQSAVVIRKPGSNTIYYVFTAAQDLDPEGICYSQVNMALNAGKGDVTATKNVSLLTPATEKLTAVNHCNRKDVWVIAHEWNSNRFFAWLVTAAGVSSSPVISSIGSVHNGGPIGCMKVSPDGKHLALGHYIFGGTQFIELFDFDNATGMISSPIRFDYGSNCYGVEFSPNSKYFYYTASPAPSSTSINIYQVDLCSGTDAQVKASSQIIGTSSNGYIRTMQLGPDGKIYFSRFAMTWLGVIDSPNTAGPGCGFNTDAVALASGTLCRAGLANFNQSFFRKQIDFSNTLSCYTANFSSQQVFLFESCTDPISQIKWNFGEPSSGAANTSTQQNPSHTYSAPGNYLVSMIVSYQCGSDTLKKTVTVDCGPLVTVNSPSICAGECVDLLASTTGGQAPYTYVWSPALGSGAGPHQVCPAATTSYTVTVTDAGGKKNSAVANVSVSTVPVPSLNVLNPGCSGNSDGSITANVSGSGGPFTYSWNSSPVQTGSILIGVPAGNYTLTVKNVANCSRTASATINDPAALTLNISNTASGCGSPTGTATASVSGGTGPYQYTWNTSPVQNGMKATGLAAGNYSLTVKDANNCQISDNITIANTSGPSLNLLSSTNVNCKGGNNGTATLSATGGLAPYTFSWSGGQSGISVNTLLAGSHTATVTDANGCSASVQVNISEPNAISINTSPTSASCGLSNGSIQATVSGGTAPYTYSWNTAPVQTSSLASALPAGNYTLIVTDAKSCSQTKTETLSGTSLPSLSISPQAVNCQGGNTGSATATGSAGTAPYSILWSNGEIGNNISDLNAGSYNATLTDAAGCSATKNFNITEPSAISLNTSSTAATCGGSNGSASVSISGGTAPYNTSWSNGASGLNANSLAAGTYTATVTDAKGCTASQSVGVSNSSGPVLSLLSSTDVSCNAGNNGTATLSATGGLTPYSFTWSGGQSGSSVNTLLAGSHTATVTDANGCSASIQVNITEPDAISINTSPTSASCGGSNGSIQAAVSGGTAPYTYSWNSAPVQTSDLASALAAGNYTLTVTDANSCTQSKSETIGGTTQPVLSINPQAANCQGENTGSATATGSAGTAPYSILWSNGASGNSVSGLNAGSYSATLTDAAGCGATQNFNITEPSAISLNTSSTAATCGGSNGSASVSISGGTAPYNTSWSNGASGLNANNLAAGTYTATVTDTKGCTASQSVGVSNSSGPALSLLSSTDVSCNAGNNGTATLSATGGLTPYSFTWSGGQSGISVNTLLAGSHTATVTDANGCSASIQVTITEPDAISINTSPTSASCGLSNGSIQATVSGGTAPYTYSWNTAPAQTSDLASALAAGNYTLTVTDANSCTQSKSETIGGTTQPVLSISPQAANCQGENTGSATATGSAGTAPYSILWSNGEIGNSVSGLNAGSYSATLTDAAGCSATKNFSITEPSAISLNTSSTAATCGGSNGSASVSISGGTAPYNTSWSNGASGLNASNLAAGTYTATVTDAKGCTASQSVGVSNSSGPVLSLLSSTDVSCNAGNNGTATLSATGGLTPYSFTWSGGQSGSSVNTLLAGSHTATVTDANGCSASIQVNITEPDAISINTSPTSASCGGSNGNIQATVSGGTAPYTYSWNSAPVQTSDLATTLAAGNYTLTVTDAKSCTQSKSETIGGTTQPVLSINPQAANCQGENTGSATATGSAGTAPYTILWSNGEIGNSVSTLNAGSYNATLTDAAGCSATKNFSITEPAAIDLNVSSTTASCGASNGSASVSISGGTAPYNTSWSNGASGLNANNLAAGTYTATVTDAKGCTASQSVGVSNSSGPALSLIASTDVSCNAGNNGTATLSATGGLTPYSFTWSGGQSGSSVNTLLAGSHTATVTDANGCSASIQVTITEPDAISINTSPTSASCGGSNGSIQATVSGGTAPYTYSWNSAPVQTSDLATTLAAGNYTLTVTDAKSCTQSKSETIGGTTQPVLSISPQAANCQGENTGSATATGSAGTAPYTILWSNGEIGNSVSGLNAGSYSATLTDAAGCSTTKNFSITEPAAIDLNVSSTTASCGASNGSASVSISGGTAPYNTSWSNGASGLNANSLAAGTYTATVTDTKGCTASQSVGVSNSSGPAITLISSSPVKCNGGNEGAITVQVSGGVQPIQVSWSNGNNGLQANSLTAGYYTITATDASGCSASINQEILQPEVMQVTISTSNASCGGANGTVSAQISGGTSPYQYNWQGNISGDSLQNQLLPGDYSLQVKDAQGCLLNEIYQIGNTGGPIASIEVLNPVTCPGGLDAILEVKDISGGDIQQIIWNDGSTDTQVKNIGKGNYSVTITDQNGCSNSTDIHIQDPDNWQVFLNLQPSTCGQANGSANLVLGGATPPYSIIWSNGQTGPSTTGLMAGTATAKITDSKGCSTETNAIITDAGGLSLQVSEVNAISCFGLSDGSAKVQANGGTAPYQYTWLTGGSGNTRSGLATGLYVAEVTDANGCKAQAQAEILSPQILSATVSVSGASCGLNNGGASVEILGGTSPYFYQWSNGAQSAQAGSLPGGAISVLVTDAQGCQVSAGEMVTTGGGLSIQLQVLQAVSCNGRQDGSIHILSGATLADIQWSNGATGMTNSNLGAGRYEVIARDNGGCKDTASIDLIEPVAIQASVQVTAASCTGEDGTGRITVLGGIAPYSYTWSNGLNVAQANQMKAGSYQVSVLDASGCSVSKQVDIPTKNTLTITNIEVADISCYGLSDGASEVSYAGATGQVSYTWSNGSTDYTAENLSAGNYTILLKDQSGCETTASFSVIAPAQVMVVVKTEDAKCQGSADGGALALVSGGNLPYQYFWDGLSGSDQANGFRSGNYSLEVKDASGCMASKTFQIGQPDSLQLDAKLTPPRCGLDNGSIKTFIKGGTAPYSYTWSHGEVSANISDMSTGSYQLTVEDMRGCMVQSAYLLSDPGAPVATVALQQDISCYGFADGKISLDGSGGMGSLHFRWSDLSGDISERSGLVPAIYTAILEDSIGCADTLALEIKEPQPLTLALQAKDVRCAGGADGRITSLVNGGTTPYQYDWSDGRSGISELTQLVAGNWGLTISDAKGCKIGQLIQINQPTALTLEIDTKAANCFNSKDGRAKAMVTGGVLPYQYQWSNGVVLPQADSLGSGIYQVYVSDSNACSISGKAAISQPTKVSGQISSKASICQGDSLILFASGSGGIPPYSFTWMNGVEAEKIIHRPSSDFNYTAQVSDAHGCKDDFSKSVKVMDLPIVQLTSDKQAICAGECVQLEAKNVNKQIYKWQDEFGATRNGASVSFCYEKEGSVDFNLVVINEHQCQISLNIQGEVVVNPLPIAAFELDKNNVPLLEALIHFENNSQGATQYNWDFDSRNEGIDSDQKDPAFQYDQPGQYPVVLTATNEFGCSATATRFVEILEDFAVYVPNTFTPNRDGKNEVFKAEGIGIADANYQFLVFNKWGEKIFESQSRTIGWDGTSTGNMGQHDAVEGVFVWQLFLQDFRGDTHKYSGTVTLVR